MHARLRVGGLDIVRHFIDSEQHRPGQDTAKKKTDGKGCKGHCQPFPEHDLPHLPPGGSHGPEPPVLLYLGHHGHIVDAVDTEDAGRDHHQDDGPDPGVKARVRIVGKKIGGVDNYIVPVNAKVLSHLAGLLLQGVHSLDPIPLLLGVLQPEQDTVRPVFRRDGGAHIVQGADDAVGFVLRVCVRLKETGDPEGVLLLPSQTSILHQLKGQSHLVSDAGLQAVLRKEPPGEGNLLPLPGEMSLLQLDLAETNPLLVHGIKPNVCVIVHAVGKILPQSHGLNLILAFQPLYILLRHTPKHGVVGGIVDIDGSQLHRSGSHPYGDRKKNKKSCQ